MDISAELVGIAYDSTLQDANTHLCTITFAWSAIAAKLALELSTKGLPGIFTAVTTCEAPPPMPLNWDNQTIFGSFVSNVFAIPAYCIIHDCAHHSPNKQRLLAQQRRELTI